MRKKNTIVYLATCLALLCSCVKDKEKEVQAMSLAQISKIPKSSEGVSFNAKIDAVVSGSYQKSDGKCYTHIEDESGGLMIYGAASDVTLSAGTRISGTISGTVELYSSLPRISAIDLSKAKLSQDAAVPCTSVDIEGLLSGFDSYISRRILIEDVDIASPGLSASSRKCDASQYGYSIQLSNASGLAVIEAGKHGNLIAYPVNTLGKKTLHVYTSEMFTEVKTEPKPNEETDFEKISVPGFYRISGTTITDVATASNTWQYAFGNQNSIRSFRLMDFSGGRMISISIPSATLVSGSSYKCDVSVFGDITVPSGKLLFTVSSANDSMAWVKCTNEGVGFIIPLI